jgi:hypothetical protein
VICVAKVWELPAKLGDGGIGCNADRERLRANDGVFTIGFVPNGDNINAGIAGENACLQLSLGLMTKAITNTNREFAEVGHNVSELPGRSLSMNP